MPEWIWRQIDRLQVPAGRARLWQACDQVIRAWVKRWLPNGLEFRRLERPPAPPPSDDADLT